MKVRLKQHYQDARVHLYPGQEYDGELCRYLLLHHMAEEVIEPAAEAPEQIEPVTVVTVEPEPEPESKPKRPRRKQ